MYQTRNELHLTGLLHEPLRWSHCAHGEDFLFGELRVARRSGFVDLIPVVFPEKVLAQWQPQPGDLLSLTGQVRSYHRKMGEHYALVVRAYAEQAQAATPGSAFENRVELFGTVGREPSYRTTPLGREICDLFLLVPRQGICRVDTVPCIAWGSNARSAATLRRGMGLAVSGRIQSRAYTKQTEDGLEEHMVYECSVSRLSF